MRCKRCGRKERIQIHHVNGNHEDNNLRNKISLCNKCHDFIEAICSHCLNQPSCFAQRLQDNLIFEDTIPLPCFVKGKASPPPSTAPLKKQAQPSKKKEKEIEIYTPGIYINPLKEPPKDKPFTHCPKCLCRALCGGSEIPSTCHKRIIVEKEIILTEGNEESEKVNNIN
jgi:hypothetical protein